MKSVNQILDKWGERVTVSENEKTIELKAIIQPMHRRYKSYFSSKRVPSGIMNNNHFFMIAPPTLELSNQGSATVKVDEKSYLIRSCGEFKVKDEKIYVWAVLAARTESGEDDYD